MLLQGIRELVPAQLFHHPPGAQASAPRTSVLASNTGEGWVTWSLRSSLLWIVSASVNETGKGDDLHVRRDWLH